VTKVGSVDKKKGVLTPLIQNVIYCLLRLGRCFDDEFFVILQWLQPTLDIRCRIIDRLIIHDTRVVVQEGSADLGN
jgi:hypothetical protein